MNRSVDVCVVGGGPGGATVAQCLAGLGHAVLVVEADAFPRSHVGESLPPSVLPLLDLLGARGEIEAAGFLRPCASVVRWGGKTWERSQESGDPGFQVDRGRFDALLLAAAVRVGARVVQPARARQPVRADENWRVPVSGPGGGGHVSARFLVDAAGRVGWLPGGRVRLAPPMLALYGYWRGVRWEGPETRIDVGLEQWYWGAPLPDGSINATVFAAPDRARRARLDDVYWELLSESDFFGGCLGGELEGRVRVCSAAPVAAAEPVGDGWIKVGEAALTLDPLSSQGVQAAIANGLQAAAVVHTVLTEPENAAAAAAFYRARLAELARRHEALASDYYRHQAEACPTPFWQSRTKPEQPRRPDLPPPEPPRQEARLRLNHEVRIESVPVLCGRTIRVAPAVHPPGAERPVAFVGGVPITDLLSLLADQPTMEMLSARLAARFGHPLGDQLGQWLVAERVVRALAE